MFNLQVVLAKKIKVVCVYAHNLLYFIQDYGVVVWFLLVSSHFTLTL